MTKIAFVRKKEIPPSAPPITEVGLIGWLRQNLFSSWLNSILTVLSVYFIVIILWDFIPWAYGGHWNTKSLRECLDLDPDVACFSVLTARWKQLLFGLYPAEEYWRPTLTFIFLLLAIVPILFPKFFRFFWFSIIYPGLAVWLLWGGSFWSISIVYIGLTLGALFFLTLIRRYLKNYMIAAILAFLFTAVFFLFISNPLVGLLNVILPISLPFVESLKMGGFTLSLIVGVTGIVASFPIGILLALGRQSNLPVIKMICVGFIEFIRGVPLITLLFVASVLLNYFLPPGTNFDIVLRVVIMVTLFSAAYMAEVIRGGLAGLPLGQHEASASLGLTYWQSQRLIIMPQALKISIPGIVNTFIGLFKDTTLVSIISLRDPVGLASTIRADQKWNGIYWELYVAIGLMFFIFCWGMSQYSQYLERKLKNIQNDLFDLGADLCVPISENSNGRLRVSTSQIETLEAEIDEMNNGLEPLNSFILPGGCKSATFLHLARTICRRAERSVVSLRSKEEINDNTLIYLNRLSDWLFVASRVENQENSTEVLWSPGKNK